MRWTGQAGKAKFAGDLQMRGRYDPASVASVVFSADIRRLNSGVDGKDRNTGSSGRCEKKKGRWDRVGELVRCVFQEIPGPRMRKDDKLQVCGCAISKG